jgi:hypothetical protein
MLGSVSKLADKTFIIGFFVPVLLAFFAAAYIFQSIPVIGRISVALASDKGFTDLTYLAVTVWFLALLLLGFNYDCYRILEGYVAPFAWFPKMAERHRRTLLRLRKQHDELIASGERAKASRISWRLNRDYPPSEGNVLPTLFGNRIRAFELYPNDLYGADGVTLWPRLSTILPAQVESAINEAQAQVNFMMNICVLAAILALGVAIRLIFERVTMSQACPPDQLKLTVSVVVLAGISYFAYGAAAARIVAWGSTVKSAFDCFLPQLAGQLGYAMPATESQRKAFWDDVTRLFLYHKPMVDRRWASKPPGGARE